jgi:hypothetical protein
VGKGDAGKMKRGFWLLLVFVLPYLIVYLSFLPHWVGRTIATAILLLFLTVGSFWFSLSRRSEVIARDAKLNRPDLLRRKTIVERTLRILGVVFGIFFTVYITLPFAADIFNIFRARQPVIVTGIVAENTSVFGLSYLKQSLYLRDNQGRQNESYTFLYSFSVPKAGRKYELTVLSSSMIVLDQKELGER